MLRIFAFILVLLHTSSAISQDLYDLNNITQINLTFAEPNWDDTLDSYYAADLGQRLVAQCTVNGIAYADVGVKYKGNSTYNASNAKNPLNIELDYTTNQDYQGFTTLKLSSGKNDPSFVREVLSYSIARTYMDAPLSNYAQVNINGSYYGLFSSSEAIDADFVKRHLNAGKNNTRFKCNPVNVMGGNGSSLEYLGADSSNYFNFYELKSDYGWTDLVDFTYDLVNSAGTIETELDIDRAIWMLAFNNVLVNLDSYTGPFRQNYYLVRDDNERMTTTTWDLNESLGGFERITSGGPPGPTSSNDLIQLDPLLRLGDATFPLLNLILSDARYQKMYLAHCKTILTENFTNGSYFTLAQQLQSLVQTAVSTDPNAFYTATQFVNNLTTTVGSGPSAAIGISELMDARATFLQAESEFLTVPPSITNIQVNPAVVTANSSVAVTATVSAPNYVYLGHRNSHADIFTKTQMFDDGAHNDGAAGDGVFGANISVGAATVQYYIYAENSIAGLFSPERAEHEFHTIGIKADLVINEMMASNATTQADQDGEFDDWIELYNNSANTISLAGYYLSDAPSNPTKWAFPSVSIAPNDYLIIWADKDTLQAGNHANFKLSAAGDELLLVNPSLQVVDEASFGFQAVDKTYGRYPNGTGPFMEMEPTYSAENSSITAIVERIAPATHKIYPNPASTQVFVEFEDFSQHHYQILSLAGARVAAGTTSTGQAIDVSRLVCGMYLLQLDGHAAAKLLIR